MSDWIRDYHVRGRAAESMPASRTAVGAVPQPEIPEAAQKSGNLYRATISRRIAGLPPRVFIFKRLDVNALARALVEAREHRASQVQLGSAAAAQSWAWVPNADDVQLARVRASVVSIDGIAVDPEESLADFRRRFHPQPSSTAFGVDNEWQLVCEASERAQQD